jgi:hypothetical protein
MPAAARVRYCESILFNQAEKIIHHREHGENNSISLLSGRTCGCWAWVPAFEVRSSSIRQLKNLQFSGSIGTICFHDHEESELYDLGATFVIHPLIEAGKQLTGQLLDSAYQTDLEA